MSRPKDQQQEPQEERDDLELRAEDADQVVGGDGKTTEPTPTESISFNFGKIKYNP
jgi:hypothetical protein